MGLSDLNLHWTDRYRPAVLLVLVGISVALEIVVHHAMGIEVVYSHFFYVPVVLGAVWYGKRAVLVGLFLAAVYIGDYLVLSGGVPTDVLVRSVMFVGVGLLIGLVIDSIRKEQERVMVQVANAALDQRSRGGFRGNLDEWKARLTSSGNVRRMKEERDTAGLVLALRHRDAGVQYEAAEALGLLREPSAVPSLMAALTGDRYSGVRWKAAEALARIGAPAVEPLIQALGHQDEDVRWKAAIALGEIADMRAVPPLIALLGDDDRFVQSRASYALGQFGNEGIPPLKVALESPSPDIRRGSARALGRIRDPQAMDALLCRLGDPDDSVRAAALEALTALGDDAYPRIIAHIRGSAPPERARALQSIREIPDRKVLGRLGTFSGDADDETKAVILSLAGGDEAGPAPGADSRES